MALLALTVLLHSLCEDLPQALEIVQDYGQRSLRNVEQGGEGWEARRLRWAELFAARTAAQPPSLGATLRAFWTALELGQEIPDPWGTLTARLLGVREKLEQLRRAGLLEQNGAGLKDWREVAEALVPHYLHMMSNRLGLFALEEAYLGHLASRLLVEDVTMPVHQPRSEREAQE